MGDGQWPPDVAGVDGTDQQEALGPSRVYMRLCVCVCVTVSRLLHTHTGSEVAANKEVVNR